MKEKIMENAKPLTTEKKKLLTPIATFLGRPAVVVLVKEKF